MTTPLSSYYVLGSSGSHNLFPGNLNNSYSNHLANPILPRVGGLEVAVTDVYFTPAVEEKKTTIFGHEPDDNVIRLTRRRESYHEVENTGATIRQFVDFINAQFRARGIRISINLLATEDAEYFVMHLDQPDHRVEITQEFAYAFGFTQPTYDAGKSIAERPFRNELFKLIDKTHNIRFTIYSDEIFDLRVPEPEVKSVSDLITAINNTLKDYDVFFTWDSENLIFEDENPMMILVRLSNFLENLFGVPSGTVWSGAELKIPSYSQIDLGLSSELHVVACNLCEDQYYKGLPQPILRIFPHQGSKSMVHVKFDPLQYVPLCEKRFDNIRVQFLDENLRPSIFKPESETVTVLHIRDRI